MAEFSNDEIDESVPFEQLIICAIDFETTGQGKNLHNEIIEIGAIKFQNGEIIAEFNKIIQPIYDRIPARITDLTGINNDDVSAAPTIDEVEAEFINFINGTILVEHSKNNYDKRLLVEHFSVDEITYHFNTLKLMRRVHSASEGGSLGNLCEIFEIPIENPHHALDDAKACGLLFYELIKRANIQTLDELIDLVG
ncbi:MAG: 3'-5' exonuclease [Promethearchaeota archaeon]